MAGTVLVAGLAASLAGANAWRIGVTARERASFQTTATNVTDGLSTLLRRDTDFVRAVRAVLTMEPNVNATRLQRWLQELEDREAQPLGFGATITRKVPARQLRGFLARRNADPAFRRFVGGQIEPIPVTGRPYYCLLAAGTANITFAPELSPLLQQDWCDPASVIGGDRTTSTGLTRAQATRAISESGQFAVYPLSFGGISSLIIEGAFYEADRPLRTSVQRNAAVLGWVSGSFNIPLLMQSALRGLHGYAISLYHTNAGVPQEFIGSYGATAGPHPFRREAHATVNGDWLIRVAGTPTALGLPAGQQALAVLLAGVAASLLLSALIVVLARSRQRALDLVRDKTAQLRHQALHDPLTGLPNRVLALDRAEHLLAHARRSRLAAAALYVDLDGFKQVNDSLGHAAGDALLRLVASRLTDVIREADTAARLGGDEFLVLLDGSTLDVAPELVAERLLEVLRRPYRLDAASGRELSLTVSVGVAVGANERPEELLREADIALYEAKAAGRNRYALYRPEMQTQIQKRLTMQMDLAEAVESDQLYLLYQPIFDLRSRRIIAAEALLRWRHPEQGVISPHEFIPIAEQSDLILAIGRKVLQEAWGQHEAWRAKGYQVATSINVSALQLEDDGFPDAVRETLNGSDLAECGQLVLEVTETVLMRDPEASATRLRLLKDLGVRVAIDDFGTGYSSLAYLREFPADMIKIDRSFLNGTANAPNSPALLDGLVQLANALCIKTLAEGIERDSQLTAVRRAKCDYGQGFLFARPLQADALEALLDRATGRSHAYRHRAAKVT